jgi:hypothetical protein
VWRKWVKYAMIVIKDDNCVVASCITRYNTTVCIMTLDETAGNSNGSGRIHFKFPFHLPFNKTNRNAEMLATTGLMICSENAKEQ